MVHLGAETRLLQGIEDAESEIVALCQSLCRIPTVNPYSGDRDPSGERAGQEFLAPILEGMGASIRLFDCPADIYQRMGVLGPADRDFRNRPNLVAEFDLGRLGPRIVITGHMDTVGVDGMTIDPFAAEARDGFIWARGSGDCKGGIAVAVKAIEHLLASGADLCGSIVFESVVDEECNGSGAGTLACLDAGYTGDVAVFVDGDADCIVTGCSGCLTADVLVTGKEGHAAYGTGVSAIDKACIVKDAIDAFKRERESARPHARVNIGVFHAGVHPAVVPGRARLSLNIVYEVDEAQAAFERTGRWNGEPVRERMVQMIREAEAGDDWLCEHPSGIIWVKDLIPFSQPDDLLAAAWLAAAHETVTGSPAPVRHLLGWSDSAYYAALGRVPTVLAGVSGPAMAHSQDERVEIAALVRRTKTLALFLLRTLGQGAKVPKQGARRQGW